MSHPSFDADVRRVAHAMADAARAAILPYFRDKSLTTDNTLEGGFDPVTQADRAAEQAMRAILKAERPEDGILGEEFGAERGTSGLTWVLDPIDGTRGFVSGTPTWGVLIALSDEQGPFYGIIDQPYIGERFEGAPDCATCHGPQGHVDLHTRPTMDLADAIVFTTFPEVGSERDREGFAAVAEQA